MFISEKINDIKEVFNNIKVEDIKGIEGFEMSLTKREEIRLQNETTDYILENGSMVQTTTIAKPIEITITGKIAEKEFKAPQKKIGQQFLQTKLSQLSILSPSVSSELQRYLEQAEDYYRQAEELINKVSDSVEYLKNISKDVSNFNQEKKFWVLYSLWKTKTLLKITTPYCNFDNMIIINVDWQQEQSYYTSDVSITFKQITFSKELKRSMRVSNINKIQGDGKNNNGKVNKSVFYKIIKN